MTLRKRIEALEDQAQQAQPVPSPEPPDVDALAARMAETWQRLDAGELDRGTYYGRGMWALRDALQTLGVM